MKKFTACALLLISGTVLSANTPGMRQATQGMRTFFRTAALRNLSHKEVDQKSPEGYHDYTNVEPIKAHEFREPAKETAVLREAINETTNAAWGFIRDQFSQAFSTPPVTSELAHEELQFIARGHTLANKIAVSDQETATNLHQTLNVIEQETRTSRRYILWNYYRIQLREASETLDYAASSQDFGQARQAPQNW